MNHKDMSEIHRQKVRDYYDYTLNFYKLFWHGDTHALHYGIWNERTKSLRDSLVNTNKFLAEKANIRRGEKVLDAGCGIGGSALWLAENLGAQVVGITISQKQLAKAKELAKRKNLEKVTEFYLKDYTATDFPDASFDVVWAIESVCYAENKLAFLKEAYRILRHGGRLIVADGFIERDPQTKKEETELRNFLIGWVLQGLARADIFEKDIAVAGFNRVRNYDNTKAILPTAFRMFRMCRWAVPLAKILCLLKLISHILCKNNQAGKDQYDLFKNGVLSYRVFLAEK